MSVYIHDFLCCMTVMRMINSHFLIKLSVFNFELNKYNAKLAKCIIYFLLSLDFLGGIRA